MYEEMDFRLYPVLLYDRPAGSSVRDLAGAVLSATLTMLTVKKTLQVAGIVLNNSKAV